MKNILSSLREFLSMFFGVFIRPRAVISRALNKRFNYIWPLLTFYLISETSLKCRFPFMESWNPAIGIGVSILISTFESLLTLAVAVVLFYWLGRRFGGKGSWKEVAAAYLWSLPPIFLDQIILMLNLYSPFVDKTIFFVFTGILAIWSAWILVVGLSQAHRISAQKALHAVLLVLLAVLAIQAVVLLLR